MFEFIGLANAKFLRNDNVGSKSERIKGDSNTNTEDLELRVAE